MMSQLNRAVLFSLAVIVLAEAPAMAIEEAPYQLVRKDGPFEIRDYAPHLLAETLVRGDFEEAGSNAFQRLFRYISGANRARSRIAMTAPVSQEPGEKIQMTAPVGQEKSGDQWVVSFMMPTSYTLETLPVPDDPEVTLREVSARRMAAVRYSGFWSEGRYAKHKRMLDEWMRKEGLKATGEPVWARYNAPYVPWFMRRNEILVPIAR